MPEDDLETQMLKIDKIVIDRIHHYGKFTLGRTRSIIANFQRYGDRQFLLQNHKLLPPGIYVNEDFPPEIDRRRNILRPILRMGLKLEKYRGKITLSYDKLIVDGKLYTMANRKELPDDLDQAKSCKKEDTSAIGSFGQHSPYSNFYISGFKVNGETYYSAEQFIQANKASIFEDDVKSLVLY